MPADQPGWRPDPERPGGMRWWNGLGWSDARRAADATVERAREAAADAIRGSTISPQQVARTMADRSGSAAVPAVRNAAGKAVAVANPLVVPAIVLGVLGITLGLGGLLPLAGLIVSIAGLVRSRRLANEGRRNTGFGGSLGGLALSVIGLLRWIPVVAPIISSLLDSVLNS